MLLLLEDGVRLEDERHVLSLCLGSLSFRAKMAHRHPREIAGQKRAVALANAQLNLGQPALVIEAHHVYRR